MKLTVKFNNMLNNLYTSFRRFPVAILLCIIATVILIILTHFEQNFSNETREILGRIVMVLALGVPVFLCISLLFERNTQFSKTVKLVFNITGAAVMPLYYFFLLPDFKTAPVTRYISISLALYMIFLFIPYFFRRDNFELYIIRLFARFCTTVIYSIVLFLGIAAILFTVDRLLMIPVSEKLYFDVWLAIVGIFAPCFFLGNIPARDQILDETDYAKLLRVLLLYIIMPLISIYSVILYIYFVKIIVTLQWPVGLVAHLVLWYSVISAIVIFFISPLADVNRWANRFIFWLPKLILPLILMLFVSVGIRVNAYGITENRYFVIILGIWAFGIMTWLAISKVRRNIILLISLSIIAVLSVTGPWSAYSVSKLSQNIRLESILNTYGMISAGKVVKPVTSIPEKDKAEISRILNYFSGTHKFSDVRVLPENFKWENMQDTFGFSNTDYISPGNQENYFSYGSQSAGKPIEIKGYDYLMTVGGYNNFDIEPVMLNDKLAVKYENKAMQNNITIVSSEREIYNKSLMEFIKQLYDKYKSTNKNNFSPDELTLTDENNKIKVKIIIQNIRGSVEETSGDISIEWIEFNLLFGMK